MESNVDYIYTDNEIRAKYNNLYYINNKFVFLTTNKNIILKKVRISITSASPVCFDNEIIPTVILFENIDKLCEYVNTIKYTKINGITGYFSHYYDWNVAHGLYDSLYPIFLTYLFFFNNNSDIFNIFINLLYIPGWTFPGISSRDWVLDIFKQFSGGKFIKENVNNQYINENFKFEILIMGNALAGITAVNKNGQMPGREIYALEKFRDRMLRMYNIQYETQEINNNKVIRIINSRRYSKEEKDILLKIVQEFKIKGYDSEYIYWDNINSFKEQLKIMNKIDIHISGAGTSMLNFPFLRDDCVHINLGVNKINESKIPGIIPGFFEVNCCLLSNNIYCDYYNVFEFKQILYTPLVNMINSHIDRLESGNTSEKIIQIIPEYIKIWRQYCKDNSDTMDVIIKRMSGLINPNLVSYRWPELLYFKKYPFNNQ